MRLGRPTVGTVEFDVHVRAFEQAVFVPVRLPYSQKVSRRFKCGNEGGLIRGVGDHE